MTTILQISIPNFSYHDGFNKNTVNCPFLLRPKIASAHHNRIKLSAIFRERSCWSFLGFGKYGISIKEKEWSRKKRGVSVRSLGGGNGGDGDNSRFFTNVALGVGLTYLTVTGQLGWLLDAIVSIWLFVVLVPLVGLGVFIWWAGRDIVQSTCPNCGNDFQIFKSALNDEVQVCPFCSQPFSVVDNKFVADPIQFSNRDTIFGQAFDDFSPSPKKGKDYSKAIVDVEAEIKDVE